MLFIKPLQYKANLHCHSTLSDGRRTPCELVEMYKSRGYSILAITDHEHPVDHTDMTQDGFLMLTGYEVYIRTQPDGRRGIFRPEVHLNLFARDPHNTDIICPNDNYIKYITDPAEFAALHRVGSEEPRRYETDYINMFIETARKDGYLVAYNHVTWSLEDYAQVMDYRGCFSMEICNYSSYNAGVDEYDIQLYDMILRRGTRMFAHSADDNHNKYPDDDKRCDSFGGFAMICAEELSYPAVIAALEHGDFYSSMEPVINMLDITGNIAHIEVEGAYQLTMLYGAKHVSSRRSDNDGGIIKADFEIPEDAPFVRFSVRGFDGKRADTRGYFRDEFTTI